MLWEEFLLKKVFVIVDTSQGERRYSGILKEITYLGKGINKEEMYLLLIEDKYSKEKVGLTSSSIRLLQEEK